MLASASFVRPATCAQHRIEAHDRLFAARNHHGEAAKKRKVGYEQFFQSALTVSHLRKTRASRRLRRRCGDGARRERRADRMLEAWRFVSRGWWRQT